VLLRAAQAGKIRILWIAVGPALAEHSRLGEYQALNDPRRPLSTLPRELQLAELAEVARKIAAQLALSSVARTLNTVDVAMPQLDAVHERRLAEEEMHYGVVAHREPKQIEFRSDDTVVETITAADIRKLDRDSLDLIETFEISMRQQ
jgi:hypothetical protein